MKTKKALLTALMGFTVAGFSAVALAGDAPAYGRSAAPAPLEGTWVVTIHPTFCEATPTNNAGDDVPGIPGIVAYLTFARGGTITETNSNPFFEPGQRGPGHGYWERTGRTSYQFVVQAFIQFDSTQPPFRYTRGYQRLDQTLELQTPDEFSTTGLVRFFAGTSTTAIPPSGCARSSGVRLD